MRKIYIYIAGVTLLGLLHAPLKEAASNTAIFVGIAVIYLIILRLIAEKFGKP